MQKEYTYGVARIRALETTLLSDEAIGQLLSVKSVKEGITFLKDRGWGNSNDSETIDEMMDSEKRKTLQILDEVVDTSKEYEILTIQDEYHNLKAAIKQVCTNQEMAHVFIENTALEPEFLKTCIREGKFESLPETMGKVAKEATDTLLRTGDGQLCDLIVDRATMEALLQAGKESDNELVQRYAEILVAIANIKIAFRGARSGKEEQFLENSMVPCKEVSISELRNASSGGIEGIYSYLESAGFEGGVQAMKQSPSVFECWCDNQIIDEIKGQKYLSFSIGPIIAYAIARFNEIKTAKIILLGKQNGFDEDFIRERVRRMYA